MNAAKWIFMALLAGLFIACSSGGEEANPAPVIEEETAAAPAEVATPEQALTDEEQASLKAQYAADAKTSINADNAELVAVDLEKQIDSELAAEE